MRFLTCLVFFTLSLVLTADQEPVGPKERTDKVISKQNDGPFYRVNIGDSLQISVYGREDSGKLVTIDNYGEFNYLYVGTVKAAGLTIPQLQKKLSDEVKKKFNFARVIITPVSMLSQNYTIAGMLNAPGRKPISGPTNLLTAVAMAGGLRMGATNFATVERADLKHSFIIRDGKMLKVNFTKLIKEGNMKYNIPIQHEDFIYVSDNADQKIYVMGEVRQPRHHEVIRQATLIQVLAHSGGLTEAASDRVLIIRGSLTEPSVIEINLEAIREGEMKDVILRPSDIVYVSKSKTAFAEELVELAIRTFTLRLAAEAGSEAYENIEPDAERGENDFIIGQ